MMKEKLREMKKKENTKKLSYMRSWEKALTRKEEAGAIESENNYHMRGRKKQPSLPAAG